MKIIDVKPVTQKSHRIPYHFRDKAKQEVKRFLNADVIEKVPAHNMVITSSYCSKRVW